jgi:hypothetical protein
VSRFLTALFFCLFLSACGESETDDRTPVDTILHNGKVITIDANLSLPSAVAVNGTDIVAVGGEELLESYKSAITVNRWPHGYAYEYNDYEDPPEYNRYKGPHLAGAAQIGRISIANSDASAYAYVNGAIDAADRAVNEQIADA